ncbi:MAG: hypothetical protein D4R64_04920 [Porphyromonadaceae bacterium]|nr:MAG: hypothetical protein D4R64_04920 [Porphyromonadaceae bacterium]
MKHILTLVMIFPLIWAPVRCQENAVKRDTGYFVDSRDSQVYQWMKIGTQIWMSRNLNYASTKGSSCYNNDSTQGKTFGRLYEWSTAVTVCPAGWHLPTHPEWTVLADFLGDQAGEKLKELGSEHWKGVDAVVRGDSGFNALPAGFKGVDPNDRTFHGGTSQFAYFWSSTTASPARKAWARFLTFQDDELHRYEEWKEFGYSVRCIRNE